MNKTINKIRTFASEDNVSMLLGIVIVVLVGSLLFSYFKSVNKTGKLSNEAVSTEVVNKQTGYEVQTGDSLWTIAQKEYGSGYAWSQVYAANREVIGNNPSLLEKGTKIDLPKLEIKTVEYTVAAGDNLWNIAVKTCNNGYLWPAIAQNNKIANPNVIEAGQVLRISCN